MRLAHLFVDARPVAAVEIATTRRERGRGLLGRDGFAGVLVLPGVRSVHTIGMRFAIDVGFARWVDRDRAGVGAPPFDGASAYILDVVSMKPNRIGRLRRCDLIIETERGAMPGWGIEPGVVITIESSRESSSESSRT